MTLKHLALVSGAVACLISVSSPLQGSPWIEPGDAYARFKVQEAVDEGRLDATLSTWPLARSNGKLTKTGAEAPDRALWNDLASPIGGQAALTFGGSTSPVMIQGFAGAVRETGEVDFTFDYLGDTVALRLSPSYVVNPVDDKSVRFDDSFLATTFKNWTAGAGYIDRWWGPGWQSSLILSDNARPIPSAWLNRRNTNTSTSPWLGWLGAWQFTGFVGELEEERVVPSAKLIGMRFNFRPVAGLEIGLSRLIQWGGEGQPESASSLWDSFTGKDNYGANGDRQDPGNQLAGVDLRYGLALGGNTLGIYTQVVGEDEAGYLPSRKVYQIGVDWTTNWFSGDQQWFLEGVDTLTEGSFGGEKRPNYAYEHFNYQSGMRHLGRNLATTFDADARAITLGAFHFTSAGDQWHAALTYADLNRDGGTRFQKGTGTDVDYFVPVTAQDILLLDFSHTRQLPLGEARFELSIASDEITLADDSVDQFRGAIEWRIPL